MMLKAGSVVTTRYFGGYESVEVISAADKTYTVSRFGGQVVGLLPADQVCKVVIDGTRH